MTKSRALLPRLFLAVNLILPVAAHALPAVQRTADATQLPAVQSGWVGALLVQLQLFFGL